MKILKLSIGICMTLLIGINSSNAQLSKFQKWEQASYFTGFNMSVWDNYDNREVNQEDFDSLKAIGATLVSIQTQGSLDDSLPYAANIYYTDGIDTTLYIDMLDSMVNFARNAGLMYVICVRDGPGRIDVSDDNTIYSTIWTNPTEQQLYGKMLKDMAQRYLPDTLFVGMDLTVEPNPLDTLVEPAIYQLDSALQANGMDINALYTLWIDSVRTVDTELPLMVEGVYMSDPEYFSLVSKQTDNKIVYKVHIYNPPDYSHAISTFSETYPGNYWSIRLDAMEYFDKPFMKDSLLKPVRDFEQSFNVPIMVGEFGLSLPQNGGEQYLTDIANIACELGWHYTLWGFNDGPEFNYKDMDAIYATNYWNTVKGLMNCGITAIEEHVGSLGLFDVYPNPTGGKFTIQGNYPLPTVIELYDITGRQVYRQPVTSNRQQVNVSSLSKGMYVWRLGNTRGKVVVE